MSLSTSKITINLLGTMTNVIKNLSTSILTPINFEKNDDLIVQIYLNLPHQPLDSTCDERLTTLFPFFPKKD